MEFGILFTSHPNHATEPYPHQDVHARVTAEIQAADRLGYDTAWVAEHHFSNQYGIMPDVFTYLGYLAAQTSRIRLGTAVVTVPLYDPIRVVENMAFVDILSGGRMVLGLGSGYRPYEFDGFGRDFDNRRDVQEEAIDLILELLHTRSAPHQGRTSARRSRATTRSSRSACSSPTRRSSWPPAPTARWPTRRATGFGLMLSTLPSFDTLARQIEFYRGHCAQAPAHLDQNRGARQGRRGPLGLRGGDRRRGQARQRRGHRPAPHALHGQRHRRLSRQRVGEGARHAWTTTSLAATTLLHGSPQTVIARLRELRDKTGLTSLLLHYPPYYGHDKAMRSLRLFAERVMPEFRRA